MSANCAANNLLLCCRLASHCVQCLHQKQQKTLSLILTLYDFNPHSNLRQASAIWHVSGARLKPGLLSVGNCRAAASGIIVLGVVLSNVTDSCVTVYMLQSMCESFHAIARYFSHFVKWPFHSVISGNDSNFMPLREINVKKLYQFHWC